MMSKIEKLQ